MLLIVGPSELPDKSGTERNIGEIMLNKPCPLNRVPLTIFKFIKNKRTIEGIMT